MTRSKSVQWAVCIFVSACSAAESPDAGEGPLGQARVYIQEAPEDVQCVRIGAAASSVTTRVFDVVPGVSSVLALSGLPLGAVTFSGEAFPAACSLVADDAAPSWVADPVTQTLVAGVVADVLLTMRRNGRAAVAVDFVDELGQGGQPASAGTPRPLLFSEYVEGSSTYKALEITALQDSSLEGCQVAVYFNGASTANGTALVGTLLAGQSHVLCSSALGSVIAGCDQIAGLTFNGDDAIALACDGALIDAIGQVGFDPGTAWGAGDASLLDHTLRRKCDVMLGDTNASDPFDPSSEWTGHALDSFEDLGLRTCP